VRHGIGTVGTVGQRRGGKLSAYVRPGDFLEVYSSEGSAAVLGIKRVRRFVKDWAHCAVWLWPDDLRAADPAGRWLGVVHEMGAMLVRLPAGR
jgi:hypothetical protein